PRGDRRRHPPPSRQRTLSARHDLRRRQCGTAHCAGAGYCAAAYRETAYVLMKVLGIVPARGGSKGVPGKNIRMLAGKPLLQYTAEAARAATLLSRVILSTDSEEIADVGRACGLDVPFMRPKELAEDTTPTLPVL